MCEKENYVVMEVFGWGYWRICCAVELLSNLQMMACPSKAVILDVLMTDEDQVRIDACLKTRDQVRNKSRYHPGQKAIRVLHGVM